MKITLISILILNSILLIIFTSGGLGIKIKECKPIYLQPIQGLGKEVGEGAYKLINVK